MTLTLICTVGGSHEPIVRAIGSLQPTHVCFVCSADDPSTGNKGSHVQITGKGNIIKANCNDKAPSLPNIPTQAGLDESRFEIIEVAADDFDDVYRKVTAWLGEQDDTVRLIADYTGGTKTMSAALTVAALDDERVELQLVSGGRADLVKVQSGTESVMPASVGASRFTRQLERALACWRRFAYEEAAAMMETIALPQDAEQRGEYHRALDISRALAAWDRFDHATALSQFTRYKARVGKQLGLHIKALTMLNETDGPRREPLRLYDLWLNARRRASQGRYDDAVARVYRLVEWTAQWQLRIHTGIETHDIPAEKIPAHITVHKNRTGQYQAGLYQSWQLVGALLDNAAARFIETRGGSMLDYMKVRNMSILAHGFETIGAQQWQQMEHWLQTAFIPLLTTLADKDGGIRFEVDRLQLPTQWIAA